MAGSRSNDDIMSDINVTPLVDVMLVLLIVLMVTASYTVTRSLEVNLPKASSSTKSTSEVLTLVIASDGGWTLDGNPITADHLGNKVSSLRAKDSQISAVIAADEETAHRHLVKALDTFRSLRVTEVAIGVKPKEAG